LNKFIQNSKKQLFQYWKKKSMLNAYFSQTTSSYSSERASLFGIQRYRVLEIKRQQKQQQDISTQRRF